VYHTQDGGETWKRQKLNLPRIYTEGFSDVYFVDRNTGWVIGNRRVILGTTDGGETWKYLTENSNKRHEETYGQRNPTGDEPLHTFMLYDLSFPDPRNGWIAGDLGVILHTSNGGKTWSHQRGGPRLHAGGDSLILGIHFINNRLGWAVGEAGTILHTTNGGVTWNLQSEQSNYLGGGAFHQREERIHCGRPWRDFVH